MNIINKKIRIIEMKGEPQYTDRAGVVIYVDSIGQLHGTWGGCAVIPGEDIFEIIEDKQERVQDWHLDNLISLIFWLEHVVSD